MYTILSSIKYFIAKDANSAAKKPTSLSVGGYYNILSNGVPRSQDGHRGFNIFGGSVGIGFRMKRPDDFFISNTTLNLQKLNLISS